MIAYLSEAVVVASPAGSGGIPLPAAVELPQVTWASLRLGAIALAIGAAAAWVMRRLVTAFLTWRGRGESSATVFGRLCGWGIMSLAVGAALTIVFPSVRPVDVLGGVGVISIAAGIAFQTVLGNMFAGIVLLLRDRFRVGDQIGVEEFRGTVMGMGLSSTVVRTFDGRLVIIPNGVLHSKVVTVQTGYEAVRTIVPVDLDDATDLVLAREVALEAMRARPEVLDAPAPEAFFTEFGAHSIRMDLRFWSGARQLETREAQHAVIGAVFAAFRERGIATSSEMTVVQLAGPPTT